LLVIIGLDLNEFSGIYRYSFDRPYGSQLAIEDQYFDILCGRLCKAGQVLSHSRWMICSKVVEGPIIVVECGKNLVMNSFVR
jgi:hypothetical protein